MIGVRQWARPQPDDEAKAYDTIVAIRRAMGEGDMDGHANGLLSTFHSTRKP